MTLKRVSRQTISIISVAEKPGIKARFDGFCFLFFSSPPKHIALPIKQHQMQTLH
jgi:hypothetical protein